MTVYTQFTPNSQSSPPFQFAPSIGGVDYIITATWNVYGQRWYLNIFDSTGVRLKTLPLISSPSDSDILIAPSIMGTTGSLVYRESSNNFETV